MVTGDRPLPRNQELKMLLRLGVPAQFKERVWKAYVLSACVGRLSIFGSLFSFNALLVLLTGV